MPYLCNCLDTSLESFPETTIASSGLSRSGKIYSTILELLSRRTRYVIALGYDQEPTEQVLLDALCHGFVRMQQIALLVFDEGELSA